MTEKIDNTTATPAPETPEKESVENREAETITLSKNELDKRISKSAESLFNNFKAKQADDNKKAVQDAVTQALAEQQMSAEEKAKAQFNREREQFKEQQAALEAEKQRLFIEKQLNANNLPLTLANTLENPNASNDEIVQSITDLKQTMENQIKQQLNTEAVVSAPVNNKHSQGQPAPDMGLMGLKAMQDQ